MAWPWSLLAPVTSVTKNENGIILQIVGALGWQAYGKYQRQTNQPILDESPIVEQQAERSTVKVFNEPPVVEQPTAKIEMPAETSNYRCDGRIHCSQMTSCAEATWFLRNCPGTKMDGDNDGVPCEQQFCSQ
jgi:hypothetical protein